jgi:hypothetical protein|tara:strand:+ start:102 stop:329 length:228 start_codon:yes stop_codon:yes gene_type:complete
MKTTINESINKINCIYTDVLLIKQSLNGSSGGHEGLFSKVNKIQKKQQCFERYIYMFHGAGFLIAGIITIFQIIK